MALSEKDVKTPTKPLVSWLSEMSQMRGSEALNHVVKCGLNVSNSRHAILAILSPEFGWLEVKYVAGKGCKDALGARLEVNTEFGIVSHVAATGQPFESGNVLDEPKYRQLFPSTLSEMATPVRDKFGRVVAVLNLESDRANAYSANDRSACEVLGAFISTNLELMECEVREEALIQLGYILDRALTEEALIGQVIHVAEDILQFQAASLFMLDKSKDRFVLAGSTSQLKSKVGEIDYSRGEGCTGWVCEHGQSLLLQDPQSDPRWRGMYVEFPSDQISSFLCVPIMVRNKTEGALRVLRRKSKNSFFNNQFTENDLRLMQAISEQVGNGLENVRNVERLIQSERMIAWGELSAKSSHMIGNRVFALKGDINELEFLLSRQDEFQTLDPLAKSLAKNVTKIEEILQEFRDFVSATQLHREVRDINKLVSESIDEVFPKRSLNHLQVKLSDSLPPALVDEAKLKRALSEIIENSFHYMDLDRNEAKVKLTTRMGSNRAGKSGHPAKPMIEIIIEDTGEGVNSLNKAKIFEPFFTSRVKGMGLGLSIVKGIVESHGGYVSEIGEPGHGAKFVILLPAINRP